MHVNDDMFVDLPFTTHTQRDPDCFIVFRKKKGEDDFKVFTSSMSGLSLPDAVEVRDDFRATHPEDEFEVRLVKTIVETTVFMSTFVG